MPTTHFENVAVGGTFDHMHAGHKALLDYAFSLGDHVYIGVTTDNLVYFKRYRNALQSYNERVFQLTQFLKSRKWEKRSTLIPLNDIYGIAAYEKSLQALIITKDTKDNGNAINRERKTRGLEKLILVEFPMIAGNDNSIIRSTRIRKGETNREGDSFIDLFPTDAVLVLPPALRTQLRKPLGSVIPDLENSSHKTAQQAIVSIQKLKPGMIISVGDVITHTLSLQHLSPHISIIDGMTRRKEFVKFSDTLSSKPKIINEPGTISTEAVLSLSRLLTSCIDNEHCREILSIEGEEDLLALPAILCAPLHSVVVYGQFQVGIVVVEVTEKIKLHVYSLLKQFTQKKLQ